MKRSNFYIVCTVIAFATAAYGQSSTPGSLLEAAGMVNGSATNTWQGPIGCTERVCTTNEFTYSHCYTNHFWNRVCTTNSSGMVQCTNVLETATHCYTNTFPEITCTNEVVSPTGVAVREELTGSLSAIAGCDELFGMFPSNSTFEAFLFLDLRTNDWVGTQSGSFLIVSGTNVLARGTMTGVSGLGAPAAGAACRVCNHFQGTLSGAVLRAGPIPDAHFQAAYAGDYTDVACPATEAPSGAVSLMINGAATSPCARRFGFSAPDSNAE